MKKNEKEWSKMEMNYTELIEELRNNSDTNALDIVFGRKGKFLYMNDGGFVGRQCRQCDGVMVAEQLVKDSATKFGFNTICHECDTVIKRKNRSCPDYRRKEVEYNRTINGIVRNIIGGLRHAAQRHYGVTVPMPTPAERQRLTDRLDDAMGKPCPYNSEMILTRDNISSEHPWAIKRHDSEAFRLLGWYDSIIFVESTENSRKQALPLLDYMDRYHDEDQIKITFQALAKAYSQVPFTDVLIAMMNDRYEYNRISV